MTAARDSMGRFVAGSGGAGSASAGGGTRTAGKGWFVRVVGVKEIERRLKALPPRLQKKVLRQAMRAGMKIVQAAAKANAPTPGTDPYATGATKKAIKVRAARSKSRDRVGIVVKVGRGDYAGDRFYAAFREYGTRDQPARPFMKPAYQAKAGEARDVAQRAILAGVEREVRQLGGR